MTTTVQTGERGDGRFRHVLRSPKATRWILVVLALLAGGLLWIGRPAEEPKNIVIITLDGLRQDHLSIRGYARQTSRHIDELARDGIMFPTIIASGCSTKASLTSLLTSIDYRHHQLVEHESVLAPQFLTIAEVAKKHGYDTAGFVATPMLTAQMQYNQGFDVYHDFTDIETEFVDAKRVVDRALSFLVRHEASRKSVPFFVYVHLEEPHPPWGLGLSKASAPVPVRPFNTGCTYIPTKEEFAGELSRRGVLVSAYDDAIRDADEQIGRLVNQLRHSGQLSNTIVAVSTDHGLELLDRYSATHGFNPFDEVVRSFLVLYDGGRRVARADGGDPADLQGRIVDVAPTVFKLAGLPLPEQFEGVDLIGDSDKVPEEAFTQGYDCASVRTSQYKLVYIDLARTKIPMVSPDGFFLFDLVADPLERRDVRSEHPEVFERMRRKYARYMSDLKTTFIEGTSIPRGKLSPESEKRLRSLGYIQ